MQDNDDYKYVSVMFEDRISSTPENPKFYYRSPFSQVLFVKLYNFFA